MVGSSNAWGDHIGHTTLRGAASQSVIAAMVGQTVTAAAIRDGYGAATIADFVVWARAHGVRVIGGLPTELDRVAPPDGSLAEIEAVYLDHGGEFLMLANRGRYPVTAFFDTPLHLNEPCQIAHSIMLAVALGPLLGRTVGPPPGPPPDCPGIEGATGLASVPR
jgi:hypothetical protein